MKLYVNRVLLDRTNAKRFLFVHKRLQNQYKQKVTYRSLKVKIVVCLRLLRANPFESSLCISANCHPNPEFKRKTSTNSADEWETT